MNRFTTIASLAVILGLIGGVWLPNPVSAQVVYSYYPAPPPYVTYSAPATIVQPATFVQPSVSYYAPAPAPSTITYYTPSAPIQSTVTYYPPPPPTVTYSYYPPPVTTVYSAPAPVYAPTTIVSPGYVTTRSYLGLGIFRPFGVNREIYVTPGNRTTYYTPVYP